LHAQAGTLYNDGSTDKIANAKRTDAALVFESFPKRSFLALLKRLVALAPARGPGAGSKVPNTP